MGASTMSDEPIKAGEFNRALEAIREAQEKSSASLYEAIKSGFASVEASFVNIRSEVQSFRNFQMDQAEKNGQFKQLHQQHADELSGARKILSGQVEEVKEKQAKTNNMALGALVSIILMLIAVLVDIALHVRK